MSVTNSNSLYGFNVTILISVCLFHYLFLLIKLFLLLPFLLILGKKTQLKGVLVSHLLLYRYTFAFSLAWRLFILFFYVKRTIGWVQLCAQNI